MERHVCQGTIGCTRNSVPMVFIGIITHKYPLYRAYIGISHRSTLGSGYIQRTPLSLKPF